MISKHCQLLQELVLRSIRMVDGTLVQLLSSLPRLKELALPHCCCISDTALLAIAQHQSDLVHLSLYHASGYTYIRVTALFRALHGLQRLSIDSDSSIINPMVTEMWKENLPGLVVSERASTTHLETFTDWTTHA